MSGSHPAVVWFRDDLRLSDHPALIDAVSTGRPLVFVYVLDDETPPLQALGAASRWWLHGALSRLRDALARHRASLVVARGPVGEVIPRLVEECGAASIHWHDRTHERERAQDDEVAEGLERAGVSVRRHCGTTLLPLETVRTKEGGFYRVYGAFWKALQKHEIPEAAPAPDRLHVYPDAESLLERDRLDLDTLLPHKPDWAEGFRSTWEPGEAEAQEHLDDFAQHALAAYDTGRNLVAQEGTSRLSPYLRFGEISPRQVWAKIAASGQRKEGVETFLGEIGWREFARYSLFHMPQLPNRNLSTKFDALTWRDAKDDLRAWQQGRTGVPIVDAAMRQLWRTGWMHNRARMIAGSYLTKHLLIDWRAGEAWFRDTLVDADWANNTVNWQWVAGTGIEATPFFRIFNPTLQAKKFDAEGDYIRQWVPELAGLSGTALFEPWAASDAVLRKGGVRLGETYPHPRVELSEGRDRALKAFRSLGK